MENDPMAPEERKKGVILGTGFTVLAAVLALTFFATRVILKTATMRGASEPPMDVWNILFLFLLVTLAIVFLLRFVPGRALFVLFFVLAMFTGTWFLAEIFLPSIPALVIGVGLVALRYLVPRVATQNLLIVIGIAGIAVSFGVSLPWRTVLALALILALYDIGAVYWTKHMVALMKGLLARGVVFAAVLPEMPHAFGERLDRVHPGEGFMLVGTGDLAVPAMFVASLVPSSQSAALFAAAGALVGFLVTLFLFLGPDRRRPMPALPPIVAGMTIGFLVATLIH